MEVVLILTVTASLSYPSLLYPLLVAPPACRTSGTVHSPSPNVPNMMKVAGLYAEVIGVLSQARFSAVRRRFMAELRSPHNTVHTTVSIIEGMKFLRVKMFPVEELEAWFAFLQVSE